jgi:two-component system sensor histidine kinase KdpD
VHSLAIADPSDLIDLVVFAAVAVAAGGVGSGRRRTQIEAERLTAQVRHTNEQLEHLEREQAEAAAIAVRLAQTQQQVRVLEASDRLRTDLLANVSHELRTPLASILTGATDLLGRPRLPAPVHADVEAIIGQARRLERLVSDLLDMARIEAHALTLDPVEIDLGDAVEAAAARLRLASPGRPVRISLPPDGLEVLADWHRLGQILDNLLQNADRHAPSGTPITVEAAPGKRSMVVIRVIDQGPGVPVEQRERIFERFVRGVTDRETGEDGHGAVPSGTGLGLAIVRGLVEAHAGRVWIEDPEEGEGAHFAFTLPAAAPLPAASPS